MCNWRGSDFISGRVSVSQQYFIKYHHHRLSDVRKTTISLLYDLINLGDLVFSGDCNFSYSDFLPLSIITTVHTHAYAVRCIHLRVHLSELLHEFHK